MKTYKNNMDTITGYLKEKIIIKPMESRIVEIKNNEDNYLIPENSVLYIADSYRKECEIVHGVYDVTKPPNKVFLSKLTNHDLLTEKNAKVCSGEI